MMFSKALTTMEQFQQIRKASGSSASSINRNDFKNFSVSGMRKNFAVLPLVAIIGVAMTGVVGFIVYHSFSRTDVTFNRSRGSIAERMDMMHPEKAKLYVVNESQYQPNPELSEALKATKIEVEQ